MKREVCKMATKNSIGSRIQALKANIDGMTADEVQDRIEELTRERIAEIRQTPTTVTVTGRSYYVSPAGDDENDGLTPTTPWKTITKVNEADLAPGDGVFFERGARFRGQVLAKAGVTYSAYGEGEKPLLTQSDKNYADPALWVATDVAHVWALAELKTERDIGAIIFDDGFTPRKIYRSDEADGTHLDYRAGRIFNDYHDLVEDMSFYHDKNGDGRLYVRCEAGNPATLAQDIELSYRGAVIRVNKNENVTVDNLCLAYSCFGVGSLTNRGLTVRNCEIKWIGGSIQVEAGEYSSNRTWPTPYGNGIEIYGEAVDFTVDNNYFWQVYDAAATNQRGGGEVPVHNNNVQYINNVMEHCVYSVEIFYGESPLGNRSNDNTLIENNIMRMGGGFGHDARPDQGVTALIRNGSIIQNTNNYVVRSNIFDRSREKLISAKDDGGSKAQYIDNIFVQKKGGRYATRLGKEYAFTEMIAEEMAQTGTETGSSYVFV